MPVPHPIRSSPLLPVFLESRHEQGLGLASGGGQSFWEIKGDPEEMETPFPNQPPHGAPRKHGNGGLSVASGPRFPPRPAESSALKAAQAGGAGPAHPYSRWGQREVNGGPQVPDGSPFLSDPQGLAPPAPVSSCFLPSWKVSGLSRPPPPTRTPPGALEGV